MWHVFCLGLGSQRNCNDYGNGPLFINFSILYVIFPLATPPLPAGEAVGVRVPLTGSCISASAKESFRMKYCWILQELSVQCWISKLQV